MKKTITIMIILVISSLMISAAETDLGKIIVSKNENGYSTSLKFEVTDTDDPKPLLPVSFSFGFSTDDNGNKKPTLHILYAGKIRDLGNGDCRARVDENIYNLELNDFGGFDNPLTIPQGDYAVQSILCDISKEMVKALQNFDIFRIQYYLSPVSLNDDSDNQLLEKFMNYYNFSIDEIKALYKKQTDAKFGDL